MFIVLWAEEARLLVSVMRLYNVPHRVRICKDRPTSSLSVLKYSSLYNPGVQSEVSQSCVIRIVKTVK